MADKVKAERFLDAGNDVSNVNKSKITIETQYAGYTAESMVKDVNGVFRNAHFNDLHEVVDGTFEAECLHHFEYSKQAKLPSHARRDAIQNYKFFSRFSRSPVKKMLMNQAGGVPDAATYLFFERMGGKGASMQDLTELVSMSKAECAARGFDMDPNAVAAWLSVKKILRYIRKQWDFAGERTSQWQDCEYPADDIDYAHMQSHAQLTRVPLSSFAVPQLFRFNLAMKQLQIRKYREKIPGPPKRFMIIIDDSGSMSSHVNKSIDGETYPGVAWATATAIAIVQAAEGVDNKVAIGFFNTSVHNGRGRAGFFEGNAREAEALLWKASWNGGGTDMNCALVAANKFHATREQVEALIIISDLGAYYKDSTHPAMSLYTVATEHGGAFDYMKCESVQMIELSEVQLEKPRES